VAVVPAVVEDAAVVVEPLHLLVLQLLRTSVAVEHKCSKKSHGSSIVKEYDYA
jgi:hypothetical protein